MYSSKLSVSLHILSLVALAPEKPVTSDWIAGSIHTNPALVRRLLSRLKQADLVHVQPRLGVTGLAKEPKKISLLTVFKAVESEQSLFSIHSNPNPNCPVGAKIEEVLSQTYGNMQTDFEKHLAGVSLADILNLFEKNSKLP